jgi:hypothetical protein
MAYFKMLSQHFPGWTEEDHENSQSGYPVSEPRFSPSTSQIRNRSANHVPTTAGA